MSTSQLTVQTTDVISSQEWTSNPDMIEFYINKEFLEKAEKCVAFMQENDVHKCTILGALGFELFQTVDNLDDDLKGQEVVKCDGREYVVFEPEYMLEGCHAEIFKDGDIRAVFPFKDDNDNMWCDVGALQDLKARLSTATAA